ncbi:hypothetical protein ACQY0O_004134 [Thecaphora frezii]
MEHLAEAHGFVSAKGFGNAGGHRYTLETEVGRNVIDPASSKDAAGRPRRPQASSPA